MKINIKFKVSSSCDILIGVDVAARIADYLPECNKVVLITDSTVRDLYADCLLQTLKNAGYETLLLSFTAGEPYKNIHTKCKLEHHMLRYQCDRDTVIIALGGGVVGDLAGFIAATYMRGIVYIQLPTTLLAMVDSSIGGKTGVNTIFGKNLIGAFWQPKMVVVDLKYLLTLPKKQLINGLFEVLKIFLIRDCTNFYYLSNNIANILRGDMQIIGSIVKSAIKHKVHVVKHDAQDNNLRKILNLGHTIGHAIEHVSKYKVLHGYAVAYGILLESKIAELMGILPADSYILIKMVLSTLGITINRLIKFDIGEIIKATKLDKKNILSQVSMVLLKNIGEVHVLDGIYTHHVTDELIREAFLLIEQEARHGGK